MKILKKEELDFLPTPKFPRAPIFTQKEKRMKNLTASPLPVPDNEFSPKMSTMNWWDDHTSKILDIFKDYLVDSVASIQRISAEVYLDTIELAKLKHAFKEEAAKIVDYYTDAIQKEIDIQIKRQRSACPTDIPAEQTDDATEEIIARLREIIGPERLEKIESLAYTITEKQLQNLRDKFTNK